MLVEAAFPAPNGRSDLEMSLYKNTIIKSSAICKLYLLSRILRGCFVSINTVMMATTTQLSDETSLQTEPNEITLIKRFSPKEVAEHNSLEDIWIIVDGGVYDLTKFLSEHPGGKKSIPPTRQDILP